MIMIILFELSGLVLILDTFCFSEVKYALHVSICFISLIFNHLKGGMDVLNVDTHFSIGVFNV